MNRRTSNSVNREGRYTQQAHEEATNSSNAPSTQVADVEELPTYEETLETELRKQYLLRPSASASRTVLAVDTDTDRVAYSKTMKAGSSSCSKMIFFDGNSRAGSLPIWSCRREKHGFELVFSRKLGSPALSPPLASLLPQLTASAQRIHQEQQSDHDHQQQQTSVEAECNDIATDTAANIYDNKPAADNREYIHRENDDAPPAYEESDPGAEQQIRLRSTEAFPFYFDFTLPDSDNGSTDTSSATDSSRVSECDSTSGDDSRHRWLRNHEAKNLDSVSSAHPWTAFMCVERANGRMLAEIIHHSKEMSDLGTLIVHGDLAPDQHEFLVISAIPVVEEYLVRYMNHVGQNEGIDMST
ncbi:hypothetical protein COEREDRAFT_8515 [Coemansia reversa NRRL 1564]|uniref:Uncharacterized protein n=1 Tax=Coemansia reversa (strain ATCC 12441 / NRRL 1564) TaxID=763665 RepID=A0A2G5BBK6_COERN|nr:hypothetical protein COEREDRAFT_8515 [Coemansia reversa NRRL 1564]|eukprot:PIA16395.1 hypothetical protein COEREDRAFT_8515 [Coemansia reversa NRRL 1564]